MNPLLVTDIDWNSWQPGVRGVLCFIIQNGEVLLIRKKRGLGAGKINAPGGKIEPGETPLQAAIRETQEEVGVTPHSPKARGELHFQFVDGYSLHCTVFIAYGCTGTAVESPEAVPLWTKLEAVPFAEMWADDVLWLANLLKGEAFTGYFTFDADRLLSQKITSLPMLAHENDSRTTPFTPSRVLVAGCGFVGLAAARQFHALGWEVVGMTHSPDSAAALSGEPFSVIAGDINDRAKLSTLGRFDAVVDCVSSGRGGAEAYRKVYLEGAQSLIETLRPEQFVFTSSTSVYAQVDGSTVTEASMAEPERETGQILRATEEFVVNSGGAVARLAGIYGPGRWALVQKFLEGRAVIEGDGQRFINQIHKEDAASALVFMVTRCLAPGIYNVADNTSVSQLEAYRTLSAHFSLPLPPYGPIDTDRKRGWTSKRVSSEKLQAVGWRLAFPDYRMALSAGVGGALLP